MTEVFEWVRHGNIEALNDGLEANPSVALSKTEHGVSLLMFAAYCRNQKAIEVVRPFVNYISLFEAAALGEVKTVMQGLDNQTAHIDNFSTDGFTVLGLASFFGHAELVSALLEEGANPNIASDNDFKVCPLHSACAALSYDIAQMLLLHGAEVNAKQAHDVTSLHSAAHNGHLQLVKLLIEHGAVLNAVTDQGETPLSMAKDKNFTDIIDYLES